MNKIKRTSLLLVLAFLAGLSLLLYPSFSNYSNNMRQTQALIQYDRAVSLFDPKEKSALWQAATEHNAALAARKEKDFVLPNKLKDHYEHLLDPFGYGLMGYISVPTLRIDLPIYHGASDAVMSKAVGHLDWSSLPVGGEGTHCVLSSHRGLPSARLFTDLDKLLVGDRFMITVLDETMTYEIDQILIVAPYDMESLLIVPGEDLCTLVTCTPYGVNTHRLLVRGHRVAELPEEKEVRLSMDAAPIEPMIVAPVVAALLLLLLLLIAALDALLRRRR